MLDILKEYTGFIQVLEDKICVLFKAFKRAISFILRTKQRDSKKKKKSKQKPAFIERTFTSISTGYRNS